MMKLERIALIALAAVAAGALTLPNAQNKAFRACLVNSQELLKQHPQGKDAASLRDSAQKELQPLAEQIKALQAKAATGSISAAERQQADTLTKTYQATAQKWQKKIDAAIAPITKDVDAAVAKTAPEQGCTMVLDSISAGAQGTGLIIYADLKQVDITDDVVTKLKK